MPDLQPRVRWDRVGRIALLLVGVLLVYLYIGPLTSYVSTWQEAKEQRAGVAELRKENQELRERRRELRDPAILEREARKLGMVPKGERAYVIKGVSGGD